MRRKEGDRENGRRSDKQGVGRRKRRRETENCVVSDRKATSRAEWIRGVLLSGGLGRQGQERRGAFA